MKFGFSLPSGFREDIWKKKTNKHTHILAHQNTTAESCSRWKVGGAGGGGALKAMNSYIFVGGAGDVFFFLFFFFFFFLFFFIISEGSWLLWKCILFYRWWSTKMQFVQMESVWMIKKILFLEEGSPEKKKWVTWEPWWWCWLISWPYRWWSSREVKSRRLHCTISR